MLNCEFTTRSVMAYLHSFTLLLFLFSSLARATSETYRIVNNPSHLQACTQQQCFTLSQFASNSSHHIFSSTTLSFSPGSHYLTVNLTVSDVVNFSMSSEFPSGHLHENMATAGFPCPHHSSCSSDYHCQLIFHLVLKSHRKERPGGNFILLSYAKLFEVCFRSLSVGVLEYSREPCCGYQMQPSDILHSSIPCGHYHSPSRSGIHCSRLLVAVAPETSKVESIPLDRQSKIENFH